MYPILVGNIWLVIVELVCLVALNFYINKGISDYNAFY